MGAEGEGEEDEDEDVDPSEVQRRKDRLEREQWLREQVGHRVFMYEESSQIHQETLINKLKGPCCYFIIFNLFCVFSHSPNKKPRKGTMWTTWTQTMKGSETKTVIL